MNEIEIRDVVLWPKHIRGDEGLREALLGLDAERVAILRIDGVTSAWVRMDQGKNADPVPGLKPACDLTKEWWRAMRDRRGEFVSIEWERR